MRGVLYFKGQSLAPGQSWAVGIQRIDDFEPNGRHLLINNAGGNNPLLEDIWEKFSLCSRILETCFSGVLGAFMVWVFYFVFQ